MAAIVAAMLVLDLAADTALAQKRPHKPTLFVHEYSGEFAQWVEAKTLELFC
jgi:hypothetical protein